MSIVAVHTQLNFQLFVACVTSSDLHELYTIEIFSQNYVGLVSTPQVIALWITIIYSYDNLKL